MNKRFLCTALILPLLIHAQSEYSKGIKWTTDLSWEQVKQKAKTENKYIFIDAYTTWCGPCKMMDKYVYSNDTVGDFFNEHFIAVKAQMDVTDKDEQMIKDWYDDAASIKAEYMIEAYPSLLFLSPDGKIVQKEQGYSPAENLVAIAQEALTPGKTYNDPYTEYKRLVKEYKEGTKRYESMAYMIRTAMKLNDMNLVKELAREHKAYYLADSNEAARYSKENIELWASYSLTSNSRLFQLFKKNGSIIDKVMGEPGFAINVIDKTIQTEVVDSFFRMQKGETTTTTGKKVRNSEVMFMRLPIWKDGHIEPDYVEADWKKLNSMINKKFSQSDAERNVLTARIRWYQQHQNMQAASKVKLMKLEKYPPNNVSTQANYINNGIGWQTFLYATDKSLLEKAAKWMAKVVETAPTNDVFLDTYANLLYKTGRTEEAIQWEEKALAVVNPANEELKETYRNVIAQMKKGEPTYLKDGAIWVSTPSQTPAASNR
jgi:thioredoxin-related protein